MQHGFSYSDLASLPIWKRKYHLKKYINEKSGGKNGNEEYLADQEKTRRELMERYNVKNLKTKIISPKKN